ncbi:MAG: hypothetical protein ACPLRS_00225, partial [Hydrogenobacter sp.]
YGVFKQVEDFFENDKYLKGSHQRIIKFLKNYNDEEISEFGKRLYTLKDSRIAADYHVNEDITEEFAKDMLNLAIELSSKWEHIKSKLEKA